MRSFRFSLAGLMGLVLISALGVVGLRESSNIWAFGIFYAAILTILGATLAGALEHGSKRVSRLAFATVAGVYLFLIIASSHGEFRIPRSPITSAIDAIDQRLHPNQVESVDLFISSVNSTTTLQNLKVALTTTTPPAPQIFTAFNVASPQATGPNPDHDSFRAIAHTLVALFLGLIAAFVAGWFARRALGRELSSEQPAPASESLSPKTEQAL
jgi:hypothetical protein